MTSFEKSPPDLETFFKDLMLNFPMTELRKTFGYQCAYINGHMATGLFHDFMFLRLNPQDEAEFLKLPGAASFAPMQPDRPMKGYVMVPEDVRLSSQQLTRWIMRSLEFAASLPPKIRKPPKRRA